ncbi:biliverdin-producing heme oxygenase [Sphingobacterium sp. LRF_L2]|uniref:biliverdin-producing heme oxygenase n=1 Tax=Sphingobacterium sp. LRF_L2 TaxID=3369421 RepID=UPI003F5D9F78
MLHLAIKEATKSGHQETEKKVVLRIKNIKTEQDYIALLKCFYAYFFAVERAIAPFITTDILPDHQTRRNSSFIKADILALGGDLDNLPVTHPPSIANSAEAMGALYVMEGSIMGGPFIVQMLQKLGISRGFSFFSGYGADAGKMWQSFTLALNAAPQNEQEEKSAVEVAQKTFLQFGAVFNELAQVN